MTIEIVKILSLSLQNIMLRKFDCLPLDMLLLHANSFYCYMIIHVNFTCNTCNNYIICQHM